ncbi:hypothetical protein, partial [Robertkochia solimangrovi]|uniref:hypothetical protein n=1 Tax=Robertkochia solimangrovi TaxID=2213046 RepID=UPI001A7EA70F
MHQYNQGTIYNPYKLRTKETEPAKNNALYPKFEPAKKETGPQRTTPSIQNLSREKRNWPTKNNAVYPKFEPAKKE